MNPFSQAEAEIYFPDLTKSDLSKTTHLGIGAHQDDLEMLALHGILTAYDDPQAAFTGVTVTDGRGAPRTGPYADITDDGLRAVRFEEQKAAARIGKFQAQIFLDYPSKDVKFGNRHQVVEDLKTILQATQPEVIYTHNLADKHDTHVAVALAVLAACRESSSLTKGSKIYGCEVWRGLDWLPDDQKVALDVSAHPEFQEELLAVYKSQIAGGKRYDLAAVGRNLANATFYQSHVTDQANRMVYAMDLTPLVRDPEINISSFVDAFIQNLADNVRDRIESLGPHPE
jgi:LmbE family N-acetylglucosaminyl deacetylase